MFGKLKKVLAQLDAIWDYLDEHKDELSQLKADVEALKPKKKKVVTKPVAKVSTKKTTK
jgi:hypothetical protein